MYISMPSSGSASVESNVTTRCCHLPSVNAPVLKAEIETAAEVSIRTKVNWLNGSCDK